MRLNAIILRLHMSLPVIVHTECVLGKVQTRMTTSIECNGAWFVSDPSLELIKQEVVNNGDDLVDTRDVQASITPGRNDEGCPEVWIFQEGERQWEHHNGQCEAQLGQGDSWDAGHSFDRP